MQECVCLCSLKRGIYQFYRLRKKHFFTCTIKIDEIKEDNINWREFLKFAIKVVLSAAKYNKIDKKKKLILLYSKNVTKEEEG